MKTKIFVPQNKQIVATAEQKPERNAILERDRNI